MPRNNPEILNYIKRAKHRLTHNDYAEYAKEKYDVFYVNNRRVTKAQLEILHTKIEEILASDEFVYDQLHKLILDEDEFNSLEQTGKMRYLLELSNVYKTLKQKIS